MHLIVILSSLALIFLVAPSNAETPSMSVTGEKRPKYQKTRWVKATDNESLKKYSHSEITHITFHHEGYADGKRSKFLAGRPGRLRQSSVQRANNIHNQHVDDKFGMIAYNYVVNLNGDVVKGRPIAFAPATYTKHPKTNKIANFEQHVAVVMLGDFDFEELTTKGRRAMISVMSEAQRKFRVPTSNIQPHKDHIEHNGKFGTGCPGKNIYRERERLAKMTLAYSLQKVLAQRGCYKRSIDGKFGTGSKRALSQLNQKYPSLNLASVSDQSLWNLLDNIDAKCK